MRNDLEKRFDSALTKAFGTSPDVLKWLKNHERKHLCVDNLCEQVKIIERRQFNLAFDVKKYERLIKDFALMFAKAAILHAEEKMLSSAEINRQVSKRHLEKDLELQMIDLEKEAFKAGDEFERDIFKQKAALEETLKVQAEKKMEADNG